MNIYQLTTESVHTTAFFNHKNFDEYTQKLAHLMSLPKQVDEVTSKYEKYGRELIESLNLALAELNQKRLSDFFFQYSRYTAGLNITTIYGRVGSELLSNRLKELSFADNLIPEIIATITYPDQHTPLFNSQLELLYIGKEIQTKGISDPSDKLKIWVEKYGNIPVNYCEEPWTIDDGRKQLDSILLKDCDKEIQELIVSHQTKVEQARNKISEIGDEVVSNLAYSLAQATSLNEYRKNIFSFVSLNYRPIFLKIVQKLGSDNWRDAFYLTPEEMLGVLENKLVDLSKLKEDRRVAVMYIKSSGELCFTDQEIANSVYDYVKESHGKKVSESVNLATEIKGLSACKGKVRGIARVILSSKDFSRFNKDEILVATMTSVDFVPLMEKAAAFVTNEGGVTSHASIVAREMNKPCIIGTKIATKVLKDGDMVEVDANTGIVKILK